MTGPSTMTEPNSMAKLSSTTEPSSRAASSSASDLIGCLVQIRGLQARSDLNGCFGVTFKGAGGGRVAVRLYTTEYLSHIKHIEDVRAKPTNLRVIELCVLIASHVTSSERLMKLVNAIMSIQGSSQMQLDHFGLGAMPLNIAPLYPKILLGLSCSHKMKDKTDSFVRMAFGEKDPRTSHQIVEYQGCNRHTQLEHFQKLVQKHVPRNDSFVIFHDDDDISSSLRTHFMVTTAVSIANNNDDRDHDDHQANTKFIPIACSVSPCVVEWNHLMTVDELRRDKKNGVNFTVQNASDVERLLKSGHIVNKTTTHDRGGGVRELFTMVIASKYVHEFFDGVAPTIVSSQYADMALSTFIIAYPGARMENKPRGPWLYFYSNSFRCASKLTPSEQERAEILDDTLGHASAWLPSEPSPLRADPYFIELLDLCYIGQDDDLERRQRNMELSCLQHYRILRDRNNTNCYRMDDSNGDEDEPLLRAYRYCNDSSFAMTTDAVQASALALIDLGLVVHVCRHFEFPVPNEALANVAEEIQKEFGKLEEALHAHGSIKDIREAVLNYAAKLANV